MTNKTTCSVLLAIAIGGCGGDEPEVENESTATSALLLLDSKFEIDLDANIVVDVAGNLDWANVAESRKSDLQTGQNDDSYGGGAKEDDACPSVGTGSIPNNKSDLKTFAVYVEPGTTAGDPGYLHVAWSRVQDPTGTTLMDFEFNQSSTKCANGVNPIRTAGDFLIEYQIDQGGQQATLKLRTWTGAAWGPETNLGASAIGTINTSSITAANSDGFGALTPRTFGEASIDLDLIFDDSKCTSFGSAFVKSRSSDAFNSALKDFIAPTPVSISNCGRVVIRKQTQPDGLTDSFAFTHNLLTDPAQGSTTFNLADNGVKTFTNVLLGNGYTVTESAATGFNLTSIDCSASSGVTPTVDLPGRKVTFAVDSPSDVVDCTYTNTQPRGALVITKTRKHAAAGSGDHPHAGVTFTISGGGLASPTTVTTNALGVACLDNLAFSANPNDYTVTETVPAGYVADEGATKTATVTKSATCLAGDGDSVLFRNTPLTNVTVSVDSLVVGGTASTIQCTGMAQPVATGVGGDGSVTLTNQVPGTYTCTIVVDP
jgi:hypothetical protein